MRLATMIVAVCAGLVQGGYALLVFAWPQGTTQAAAAIAVLAATATFAGGMAGIVSRAVSGPALVAGGQLVFAALAIGEIVSEWRDASTLGTDAGSVALLGVAAAGFAGIAFAALLCSWPRQAALIVAGALVLVGMGTAAAGATVKATGADCDRFHFDRARWASADWDDHIQLARTVARCGTLVGDTRAQVRALLGPTDGSLRIEYGPDGRVRRAWVEAYPD